MPVVEVALPALGASAAVCEVWRARAPLQSGRAGAVRYRANDDLLFGCVALYESTAAAPAGGPTPLECATLDAYGQLFRLLDDSVLYGQSITYSGKEVQITLASGADWHLFAGDATAVPGAFAMMEALPASVPALAFLQVDDPQERQPIPNDRGHHGVTWRYESPNPEGGELLAALAAATFPGGRGHAYLAGEVALVTALKATLESRGWSADQISAKAYWNRGRANAGHGEPELKAS